MLKAPTEECKHSYIARIGAIMRTKDILFIQRIEWEELQTKPQAERKHQNKY